MKKIIFVLVFLAIPALVLAGKAVEQTISSSPGSGGTWTSAISSTWKSEGEGYLNISISGSSWSATVTLQRSFSGSEAWHDVETWTANAEQYLVDRERGVIYRIGVKNGEYTSGSVAVRLSK